MPVEVEVVDLGINNLGSLVRGFRAAADVDLRVIARADESRGADLLVVPGVGAYGAAMTEFRQRGLDEIVLAHAHAGYPLFGVCLGMQLLGDFSEESPGVQGLGLIPGGVRKLEADGTTRVPNMGWGAVQATATAVPFPALSQSHDFYFVHSYAMHPAEDRDVLIRSQFGGAQFVSGVLRNNVIGIQFHPEKSSRGGITLLREIADWARG